MYQIILKPRAIQMMKSSYKYYELQKTNLGEEFLHEVQNILSTIKQKPYLFASIQKPFSQAPIKRFPFVIIYQVIEKQIVVFAVFHTKRNPDKKIQ